MENFLGMKEMYDINLRAIKDFSIGNKRFENNEAVLSFSKAEIGKITQQKVETMIKGGFRNSAQLFWEDDKEVDFYLQNGVFTKQCWSVLSNSQLKQPDFKSIQYQEDLKAIEDDNYCYVDLKFQPNCLEKLAAQGNPNFESLPMGRRKELELKPLPPSQKQWLFIYNKENGQRITDFTVYNNRIFFKTEVREVHVDYTFFYKNKINMLEIGNRNYNNFFKLTAKASVKDQKIGNVSTVYIEIPKIKITSNLEILLGQNYNVGTTADFYFRGFCDDIKTGRTMNVTFLETELTGDYIE